MFYMQKCVCKKLNIYTEQNIPVIIVGDIKIDTLDRTTDRSLNYVSMLSSIGFCSLVEVSTCFTDTSRSFLDHGDQDRVLQRVLDYSPTNHLPVYTILKGGGDPYLKIDKNNVEKWRFIDKRKKEKKLTILAKELLHIDLSGHPDEILESLTEATKAALDICYPLKTKSNRAKKRSLTPWFDSEIFRDEKTQATLFRRFIKS